MLYNENIEIVGLLVGPGVHCLRQAAQDYEWGEKHLWVWVCGWGLLAKVSVCDVKTVHSCAPGAASDGGYL